ncbi:hypothetical protein B0H19DRAFT_1065602 [Mycena capillaripes]|nr:hypothetical protein B0H19DRAFT_1065602 [Mycena capillaripes]
MNWRKEQEKWNDRSRITASHITGQPQKHLAFHRNTRVIENIHQLPATIRKRRRALHHTTTSGRMILIVAPRLVRFQFIEIYRDNLPGIGLPEQILLYLEVLLFAGSCHNHTPTRALIVASPGFRIMLAKVLAFLPRLKQSCPTFELVLNDLCSFLVNGGISEAAHLDEMIEGAGDSLNDLSRLSLDFTYTWCQRLLFSWNRKELLPLPVGPVYRNLLARDLIEVLIAAMSFLTTTTASETLPALNNCFLLFRRCVSMNCGHAWLEPAANLAYILNNLIPAGLVYYYVFGQLQRKTPELLPLITAKEFENSRFSRTGMNFCQHRSTNPRHADVLICDIASLSRARYGEKSTFSAAGGANRRITARHVSKNRLEDASTGLLLPSGPGTHGIRRRSTSGVRTHIHAHIDPPRLPTTNHPNYQAQVKFMTAHSDSGTFLLRRDISSMGMPCLAREPTAHVLAPLHRQRDIRTYIDCGPGRTATRNLERSNFLVSGGIVLDTLLAVDVTLNIAAQWVTSDMDDGTGLDAPTCRPGAENRVQCFYDEFNSRILFPSSFLLRSGFNAFLGYDIRVLASYIASLEESKTGSTVFSLFMHHVALRDMERSGAITKSNLNPQLFPSGKFHAFASARPVYFGVGCTWSRDSSGIGTFVRFGDFEILTKFLMYGSAVAPAPRPPQRHGRPNATAAPTPHPP